MTELTPLLNALGLAISVLDLLITLFGLLAAVAIATFAIGLLVGYAIGKRRLTPPVAPNTTAVESIIYRGQ